MFNIFFLCILLFVVFINKSFAQKHEMSKGVYNEVAHSEVLSPPLPEDMTLEETLKYSERDFPPPHFPHAVMDNESYLFTLLEQLEYRFSDSDSSPNLLGWEAQGWYGNDYHRFWWKSDGEAIFEGTEEVESKNDLLYSQLITPFWSFQIGAQYANKSTTKSYNDRWSGVIAFQGLAPYKFELNNSLYISDNAKILFSNETEYNIRITQRLVLQPRVETQIAAQNIPNRDLGSGITDASIDLRVRYEIKRGLAPYIGVRYRFFVGKTKDIAQAAEEQIEAWSFVTGLRLAF